MAHNYYEGFDMDYTPTTRAEVIAIIKALTKFPGEQEYLAHLLLHMDEVVIRTIPADVADITGPEGFAAGTLESTLATIRHLLSNYDPDDTLPPQEDKSLMGLLRMAGLTNLPPGERMRRLNNGPYASPLARLALKGIVAIASIQAAKRDGVILPSH